MKQARGKPPSWSQLNCPPLTAEGRILPENRTHMLLEAIAIIAPYVHPLHDFRSETVSRKRFSGRKDHPARQSGAQQEASCLPALRTSQTRQSGTRPFIKSIYRISQCLPRQSGMRQGNGPGASGKGSSPHPAKHREAAARQGTGPGTSKAISRSSFTARQGNGRGTVPSRNPHPDTDKRFRNRNRTAIRSGYPADSPTTT